MTTKNVKFSDSPPKSDSTNIKHTGNDLSQKNKKIEQLNFEKKYTFYQLIVYFY